MTEPITQPQVRTLATVADLPLSEDRLKGAAELLTAWLPAANELSHKMSAPEYDGLMPITVLTHPQSGETQE